MALLSGSDLRQKRNAAGVSLDAVAWLMGCTFLELLTEVENEKAVSPQIAADYLAAVDKLRPMSETMQRYYRLEQKASPEDPREERERLAGAPRNRRGL